MQPAEVIQATPEQGIEFGTFRTAEAFFKEAEIVARSFALRAQRLQLFKQIGPSKHLLIEGWQTLAAAYRVTAGIVEDRYIEIGDARGFEATAEAIYVPNGQRISTAKAMCLNDEENWGVRPKYEYQNGSKVKVADVVVPLQQLRSMAQTRACSKVLSNLLKWVARMAGFAGTPAEEMTGEEASAQGGGAASEPRQPQRKAPTGPSNGVISEAQGKRLYALAHSVNKSKDEVGIVLATYGFTSVEQVTREKYEAICAEVMRPRQ